MRVTVKLFAAARDAVGRSDAVVEAPQMATVAAVKRALSSGFPALAGIVERSMMAVNAEYADDVTLIGPDDELALIPPVSGG